MTIAAHLGDEFFYILVPHAGLAQNNSGIIFVMLLIAADFDALRRPGLLKSRCNAGNRFLMRMAHLKNSARHVGLEIRGIFKCLTISDFRRQLP